jgi:maleate isomerase
MPLPDDLPIDASWQALLDALREQLDASRATLRLDQNHTVQLVAESVVAGVKSMTAGTQEDASRFPTYDHVAETRQILVQDDLRESEIRPPRSLIDEYGTLAQMVSPVLVADQLAGVISVHQVGRTRRWAETDVAVLRVISAATGLLLSASATGRVSQAGIC